MCHDVVTVEDLFYLRLQLKANLCECFREIATAIVDTLSLLFKACLGIAERAEAIIVAFLLGLLKWKVNMILNRSFDSGIARQVIQLIIFLHLNLALLSEGARARCGHCCLQKLRLVIEAREHSMGLILPACLEESVIVILEYQLKLLILLLAIRCDSILLALNIFGVTVVLREPWCM